MKKETVLPILRLVLTVLWRTALVLTAIAIMIGVGIHTALQTVLCGPSPAARDQLVLTLTESPKTNTIPVKYLDKETLAAIKTVEYTLTDTVSDPALITAQGAVSPTKETLEAENYTAQVALGADATKIKIFGERNFAGFSAEGKLLLATTQEAADELGLTQRCGHILILNGQVNEGLFNSPSGFAPRVAIGQRADGTVILITTDGWTKDHIGATWQDLINMMTHYGAVNACVITGEE